MGMTVRPAEGKADFRAIFAMILVQHAEVGRGPLDPEMVATYVYNTMENGAAFIVEKDGEFVGSVGLTLNHLWYSPQTYWHEHWLYITPPERGGEAFRAILAELRTLSQETGVPVEITVFNERRSKPSTGIAVEAQRFSFTPSGVSVTVGAPAGGPES